MKHVAGIRGFVAGALVASVIGVGGLAVVKATGGSSSASLFVAVTPVRVIDTRSDLGLNSVVSGTEQDVMIVGSVVPVGATAVALTVTAVDASAKGFMVVRAGDATGKPSTSNLNVAASGTVASAVTVKLPTVGSGAGAIKVLFDAYGSLTATTELLIDITGYYEVASVGSGSSGSVGAQGPQGERGPQGIQGEQGARGVAGADGADGADGPPGEQGVPGEPGSDGALAGLTCYDQQFIAQLNGTWQCAELGKLVEGVLTGTVYTALNGCCSPTSWTNQGGSYYGIVGNSMCSQDYCYLTIPGLPNNHSDCRVSGMVAGQLISSLSAGVMIDEYYVYVNFAMIAGVLSISSLPPGAQISVQVSCGQGIVPANNITPV